jgi:hypothetical protein
MENVANYLRVEKINFISGAHELTLHGEMINGLLSYPTQVKVAMGEINRILNKIQRQLGELDINDLLQTEQLPDGDTYFEMDFSEFETEIDFNEPELQFSYLQIRA